MGKWCMWPGKFLAMAGLLVYDIILSSTNKLAENVEEKTQEYTIPN